MPRDRSDPPGFDARDRGLTAITRPAVVPDRAARLTRPQRAGLAFVFLWFFVGGIAHFAATEAEMRIVPPYVPWPRAAVLVSGVFELLGAVGLLWRPTRRASGIGLALLTVAVTPCHIYMLQYPERFGVPLWALWLRLPIQAVLLGLIVWSVSEQRRQPAR